MKALLIAFIAGSTLFSPSFVPVPAKTDTIVTRFGLYASYFSPEKLYLHLDRTAFCPGETIWFNGYLKDASENSLVPVSNYIYVELLKEDGTLVKRVKIKRDGDGFPGHIDLQEDLGRGFYTVRAYTLWQLDSPAEYMFHQQVRIVSDGKSLHQKRRQEQPQDITDISFYPEGGRYFNDLPACIGFKAMDHEGRSLEVAGEVINQKGERTSIDVHTLHDGMGMIRFIPQEGSTYYLSLASGERFKLPDPSSDGATISIFGNAGKKYVRIFSCGDKKYSLLLRDISQLRHVMDVEPEERTKTAAIQEEDISYGINHLLLTDSRGTIVAERLFFKYDNGKTRNCTVSASGSSPEIHEPVTAILSLKDKAGAAVDGICSISITGQSLAGCAQDDGIVSYMSLSSELRGSINEPGYYFDDGIPFKERAAAMDLLLMIQGWKYYDLDSISDPDVPLDFHKQAREYVQRITGKVSRLLSSKVPKKFLMAVLVPRIGATAVIPVEEGKRFVMDSLDLEEGTGIMIRIKREEGITGYVPTWDGEEFADQFAYKPAPGHTHIRPVEVDLSYVPGTDTIATAVVTADAIPDDLGISGRTLPKEDIKIHRNMTLIDYLRMAAPSFYYKDGKMRSWRNASFGVTASGDSWSDSPVQLVVDGSVAPWEPYETMLLEECESISISTDPSPVYRATDGVVAIRIQYGASGLRSVADQPSTIYFTPLGYQSPREFYSPRYDKGEGYGDSDKRNTIYWNPSVKLSGGHAEVSFCIPDEKTYPYSVRVEGICSDGTPFSASGTLFKP